MANANFTAYIKYSLPFFVGKAGFAPATCCRIIAIKETCILSFCVLQPLYILSYLPVPKT